MGIYPRLEREIAEVDPAAVDGKGLAAECFESLEADGPNSPFAPLADMFSIDPEDAAAFAAGEGIEVAPPAVVWHDAHDGVRAVAATLTNLRSQDSDSRAIGDLEETKRILEAAANAGVRFYLTCDMP